MATIVAAAGGGDWNTGASWVGGVAPTAADDAQVPLTAGNMSIGTGAVCRSADFSTYTGTLSGTGTLTIGDGTAGLSNIALTLVAGMTVSGPPAFSFISTSATVQTVDFAGKTTGNVTYNASSGGSWQMTGTHVTGASATVTFTKGTLDVNGQTCTWGIFNSNNSNTRTISLGAASITMIGANTTVWQCGDATNLAIATSTATITLTGTSAGANLGSNKTWTGLTFVQSGSGIAFWGTASTVANYTRTGTAAKGDTLEIRADATCTGTFTCTGNSDINRINLRSNTNGTVRTITAATVAVTRSDLRDITGAGAGSWDLSAVTGGSGDQGGNTSITFSTATEQTWSGTSGGNWSTNAWTSRVPLPQDDVVISSAFDASQTVTADMPRLGKSITWAGATGSPTWAFSSTTNDIYGSITLIAGMTISGTQALTLRGRSTFTLTSAGKQFTQAITIDAPSGTYTLADAFSTAGAFTHTNGTFTAVTFNVTCLSFASSNSNTRALTLGTGTWSLTSTATATVWDITTATGLTMSSGSVTIVVSTASANTRTLALGAKTYGTITYTVAGSTGALVITGSNTIATLNFSDASNARTLTFTSGTTNTFTTFNVNGTATKLMTINSSTGGVAATISKSSGTVILDYLSIQDSTASGGASWYAGLNSTSVSGNSGWIFNALPISFGSESVAQIASRLAGLTKEVSTQEAIATHLGILPVTKFSVQEMLAGLAGLSAGVKSSQEIVFDNIKTACSLSNPYTQYSEQLLWTLASNQGLTLDQVIGND